jgi:hypothetical protein
VKEKREEIINFLDKLERQMGNTSFTTNNVMCRTMELRNIAMIITVLFNLLNKDG